MQERKEFYYLLAATILTRLPWIFMVPMYEAPDENTHFWVFKFIMDHGGLPGPQEIIAAGKEGVYGPLPPFGYLPHILTGLLLSPLFDPSVAPRFGSLIMALVLTYATWRLGKELFPSSRLCALALPILVVLHPQLVLTFCYSNNDVTSSTLAALLLLLSVRTIKNGLTIKVSIICGFLIAWLVLSKYTGYAVLPAVAVAFLASAWINRSSSKQIVAAAAALVGIPALVSGWWFVRNYQLFNGDVLGMQTMRRQWATIYDKPLEYYKNPLTIALDHKWWRYMFYSFWGHFGYLTRPLWKPLYHVYSGFFIASAIGLVVAMVRTFKSEAIKRFRETATNDRQARVQPTIWITMIVCLLANLAAIVWSSSGNIGGPVGRYLFTSEIPALALLIAGLFLIHSRWGARLVQALLGFTLIVYIWSFVMLFNSYGGFRWKMF